MKKRKEQGQKTLDRSSLAKWLALFVLAALAVAAVLFCFMRYFIFKDAPDDKMSDVISSTSALLGVFTIGGAAVVQLRKHIIFEEQSKLERDGRMSDRLTRAIENLHNKESLAVREGALFELKRLGLDFPREQENIVRILGPFIREGIENTPREEVPTRPDDDVFIAGEIVSLFFNETGCSVNLRYLKAEKLDLGQLQLQGADLEVAQFQRANLFSAQLQRANLFSAQLQGANLFLAQLQSAVITDRQLLTAENVDCACLSDGMHILYNRLKAEQNKTNQEA